MNGLPFLHMSINISPFYEQQASTLIQYYHIETAMNDYNSSATRGPVQTNAVHDLFEAPFVKPHFLVLNCTTNSSLNPLNQVMLTENAPIADFLPDSPTVARWRAAIDSVQAPLPLITGAKFVGDEFRFTFPGQRGRTNQVLGSTDLLNWTVLTNVTGTNLPIFFRDSNTATNRGRFYRIRRL